MAEASKQVRVDNWGIFFLSRLQVFFNKTDYCDLTLQFEGNVQLKVHRLVMNACTEYFQFLEQTCEVNDDVLMMPPDLQADVILPIVNFMYTGMLEFQMSIFDRLYKTAELMNITVLLKLLDAQSQKVKIKAPKETAPLIAKKIVKEMKSFAVPGRKPIWKRKTMISKPVALKSESKIASSKFDNTPKPTRFEWPDEDDMVKPFDMLDTAFDNISYTSEPLLTQEDEAKRDSSYSAFDDLRCLPGNNVKKTATTTTKEYNNSLDIEELKQYAREQKIRSDYVDYDDDPDDPDYVPNASYKRKLPPSPMSKRLRQTPPEKENKETKINVTGGSKNLDHTKIIGDILKKYPHLVKKNKNIRLKIVTNNKSNEVTEVTVSEEKTKEKPVANKANMDENPKIIKSKDETTWLCTKCSTVEKPMEFLLYYLYRKHMTDVHHVKFDNRSCKHCGDVFDEDVLLVYHVYMVHGSPPAREYTFPKCRNCSFVALNDAILETHMGYHEENHVQCNSCKLGFIDTDFLRVHLKVSGHSNSSRSKFDCQYCTGNLSSAGSLFVHIKTNHMKEAKNDGILSLEQDEELMTENIKVLSNVKLPSSQVVQEEQAQSQQVRNVASGIATSLGLVDIVVLDQNQQSAYIVPSSSENSERPQGDNGNFMLPHLPDQTYIANSDIASTDDLVMVLTDHDYNDGNNDVLSNDNSNIVVLYSHPVEGQQNQYITTTDAGILLNSETGMLEISNASSDGQQGESIEMIQKEIQSIQKSEADNNLKKEIAETEATNEEKPLPEQETVETEETGKEKDDFVAPKDKEEDAVDGTETSKPQTSPIPMEVDEELTEKPNPEETENKVENKSEEANIEREEQDKQEIPKETFEEEKCATKTLDDSIEPEEKNEELSLELISEEEKEEEEPEKASEKTTEVHDEPMEVDSAKPAFKEAAAAAAVEEEISEVATNGGNEAPIEETPPSNGASPDDDGKDAAEAPGEKDKQQEEVPKDTTDSSADVGKSKESCISILHDWEDTDSQQSEQDKGASVNKLINDWDDD